MNHLEEDLTKEQLADVLAYDPLPPHQDPLLLPRRMECHLEDFSYWVFDRAKHPEWKERLKHLEERRWSGISLIDRQMVMDQANEEAMDKHRLRVMKEIERLNQFSTELAMVMAEQVKTLIGNSRIEDIAALEDVVRNHRGYLAAAKGGTLPFSESHRDYVMGIPVDGEEYRGSVDDSDVSTV